MLLDDILNIMKDGSNDIYYKDITYKKLYEYVKKLYNYLLNIKKENDGKNVIVYGSKNIYMIISFLACSFAGFTYIPIDISTPKYRLESIIEVTKPILILQDEQAKEIVNKTNLAEKEIIPLLKPEDIYYIIFTSGSTGVPKGVQITYSNLDAFVKKIKSTIPVKKSKILNQALYSFDLSVADIYLTLTTKSEYIILDKIKIDEYTKILKNIKMAEVMIVTPTFLEFLLLDKSFNSNNCTNLKYIYLCGEILKYKTVQKTYERFSDIEIINAYGPTECTVAITSSKVNKDDKIIAVGNVTDNNFVILDDNLEEVEENSEGNIIIYGEQVGNGYLNYSNDKFIKYCGKRAYITGDIGYFKGDKLFFICRRDRQIKLGGYRIELGEIEKKIMQIEGVQNCVVVPKYKEEKVENIIAYVVTDLKQEIIKQYAKEILSQYMVPKIKIVEKLPVNNNFKTDIKKIEELENER